MIDGAKGTKAKEAAAAHALSTAVSKILSMIDMAERRAATAALPSGDRALVLSLVTDFRGIADEELDPETANIIAEFVRVQLVRWMNWIDRGEQIARSWNDGADAIDAPHLH